MKHLIFVAAILCATGPAFGLPLGGCYSVAEVRKQLATEGQQVATTSGDSTVMVSYGTKNSGYVFQGRSDGAFCVVSFLKRISVQRQSDVCNNPRRYPGAVDICSSLKSQALRVTKTFSGDLSQSALSDKMGGPVRATFAICADKSGHEILCGRTETLRDAVSARP